MSNKKKIIIYILGILVFQELVFRMCFPIPEISNFNRINYQVLKNSVYNDPDLFLQNKTWESSLDTDHVFVHELNEYGFRDGSWSVKKEENKKRVLFIGDSFVEGVMADKEDNIPSQYQNLVGANVEVMNAGMNGTGISNYIKLIKDIVPLFKPDEVKLILFANDFTQRKTEYFDEILTPEKTNLFTPRIIVLVQRLLNNKPIVLRGFNSTQPFLYPVPEQSNPFSNNGYSLKKDVTPEVKQAMENATLNYYIINLLHKKTVALQQYKSLSQELGIINSICLENGTKLKVYYLPGRNQISKEYLKFDMESCLRLCENQISLTAAKFKIHAATLKSDCRQQQIECYDLTEFVKNEEVKFNLFWNYDEHMNAKGYNLVANEIQRLETSFMD